MQKTVKTHPALLWLICAWTLGTTFGILIADGNVDILADSLRLAGSKSGSMLVVSAIVPVFAVYLSSRLCLHGLIFAILFLKSVADSFVLMGVCAAYGSAAWLAGTLLLFTDKIATVFLLYFAGKCLTERDRVQTARFISVLLAILVVIAVDHFCITPHFINLMF